jgi:hypothetical protein
MKIRTKELEYQRLNYIIEVRPRLIFFCVRPWIANTSLGSLNGALVRFLCGSLLSWLTDTDTFCVQEYDPDRRDLGFILSFCGSSWRGVDTVDCLHFGTYPPRQPFLNSLTGDACLRLDHWSVAHLVAETGA